MTEYGRYGKSLQGAAAGTTEGTTRIFLRRMNNASQYRQREWHRRQPGTYSNAEVEEFLEDALQLSPLAELEAREFKHQLTNAIMSLKENLQVVAVEYFIRGMTIEQVATSLGLGTSAIGEREKSAQLKIIRFFEDGDPELLQLVKHYLDNRPSENNRAKDASQVATP